MTNTERSSNLRRICVFCGSSDGANPEYLQQAVNLGRAIAANGMGLVYGGASIGLMGALADAALAGGGEVIGVIPEALAAHEIAHNSLSELHIVGSMHERKARMASLADAFIALPGGYGTLDEFLEILTWAQLGIHSKPCVMVNTAGYYDGLLRFLDHAVSEDFLRSHNRELILLAEDATHALKLIRESPQPRAIPDSIQRSPLP
jgi:uncharacterized protein (TIGR00730 family)